jgi:hypothetical protein
MLNLGQLVNLFRKTVTSRMRHAVTLRSPFSLKMREFYRWNTTSRSRQPAKDEVGGGSGT